MATVQSDWNAGCDDCPLELPYVDKISQPLSQSIGPGPTGRSKSSLRLNEVCIFAFDPSLSFADRVAELAARSPRGGPRSDESCLNFYKGLRPGELPLESYNGVARGLR